MSATEEVEGGEGAAETGDSVDESRETRISSPPLGTYEKGGGARITGAPNALLWPVTTTFGVVGRFLGATLPGPLPLPRSGGETSGRPAREDGGETAVNRACRVK